MMMMDNYANNQILRHRTILIGIGHEYMDILNILGTIVQNLPILNLPNTFPTKLLQNYDKLQSHLNQT